MPGVATSTPNASPEAVLKASGWPSAPVTVAPASSAIKAAAAMSHSKPQRRVATQIGLAGRDHGDAQRDRIGPGDRDEIAVDRRQLVGGHAGAGQLGARADPERHAVAPAALAARRGPELAADRRGEHAEHRHAVLDQSHRDAPAGPVAQKIAGAVDRIDHPEPRPLDPVAVVERLLGQPAGLGIERAELLAQEGVDREIDVADRMARHLLPGPVIGAAAAGGDPAGLLGDAGDRPQAPATVIPSIRSVGTLTARRCSRSSAGDSARNMSIRLPAMVISATGAASAPSRDDEAGGAAAVIAGHRVDRRCRSSR